MAEGSSKTLNYRLLGVKCSWGIRSFRSIVWIVPSQLVPQNCQFVPHMLYLLSKCVNVIRVQTSDRNMDESISELTNVPLCFVERCENYSHNGESRADKGWALWKER